VWWCIPIGTSKAIYFLLFERTQPASWQKSAPAAIRLSAKGKPKAASGKPAQSRDQAMSWRNGGGRSNFNANSDEVTQRPSHITTIKNVSRQTRFNMKGFNFAPSSSRLWSEDSLPEPALSRCGPDHPAPCDRRSRVHPAHEAQPPGRRQ
jgi:hypothetical protein